MLQEMLKAFLLIFIAEMGDKTQILAMAFATKYPVKKVLAGIFAGVLLNHGIAVFLGNYISSFIPLDIVQIIAGCAFIGFALWTLKYEDEDEEEESQRFKLGPVMTVAAAFFVGELGDKTQLSAITLSAGASYPLAILVGTVSGMMVTGGIGIFVGRKLGDKIPEMAIKLAAAVAFMVFGVTKLYANVPKQFMNPFSVALITGLLALIMILMIRNLFIKKRQGIESGFVRQSKKLHDYYYNVGESMEQLCLGVEHCGECQGRNCIVGHTKALVKNAIEDKKESIHDFVVQQSDKKYSKEDAIRSLTMTLALIKDDPGNPDYEEVHRIRRNLEQIVFGRKFDKMDSWETYVAEIQKQDQEIAATILHMN